MGQLKSSQLFALWDHLVTHLQMCDLIYLDHNATTPLAPEVAKEMAPFLWSGWANPSSSHSLGTAARKAVETSRSQVAAMLGCPTSEIIFTSGGTEANNYAIKGIALQNQAKGKHIITTNIEHPAVDEVLHYLSTLGFTTTFVPVDEDGIVSVQKIEEAITPETTLITIMHANNEIGSIQPIQEIVRASKKYNNGSIVVHTDASQSIGKIPVLVQELEVDLLTVTPHKFYGPKGVGALFIRSGVEIQKISHGAGHERGMRPGTENTLCLVGFGKACSMVDESVKSTHMRETRDKLKELLMARIPDARVNGPSDLNLQLPNTLSISFGGVNSWTLLQRLESRVAASAGAACHSTEGKVSKVLAAVNVPREYALGTLRLSTGKLVTLDQVEVAVNAIEQEVALLRQAEKQ